ncbi:MAG: SDR family oxidoreductase [Gemmatimonadetes bacterium]|jgi:NAD(P)-dependent dehydrogenase (short-subunit alcohol dehydrogenase family)|nr:SDR family oxidoreductase [Gemmatimonadota bacterium]
MELQDRRALVTGGGRGIGRVIALALAAAGADVALLARTRDEVAQVAAEIADIGSRSLALTADQGQRQSVEDAVGTVNAAWGGVDILVNNAGILGPVGPSHEVDPDAWLETLRVNAGGCYLCSRAVLPGMIARRYGRIINLSGGGAVSPRAWFSAYGASKAAIVRFTETLAAEVAGHGVQVNAISPGAVNTRMTEQAVAAGERAGAEAAAARQQLAGGGAPPQQAADLVVFLASSRSQGLTGRMLAAQWDDWLAIDIEQVMASDAYTVRRIKP